ncbi:MAG: heme ABC exporter ATP-binding protein CcmA [Sphingomonas sp.]|uniref:heme ABC exporter ATP-binding protein CcmA n=1 Tax=Sphingomonas sp. TaxID=28214 RepID=UPI001ACAD809|nr:heme ABC exporter ATP-binding protein CcmA [Sphingomonas sp.]MBN8808952.1 heme ABC exporter ATP-binding protein CcmA [Sphingomonas sp.]
MLTFAAVTCVRGGRMLFADLSFALAPGDALLVTGANGVGKSSLIRLAAGLLTPAAGRVEAATDRALLTEQAALDDDLPLGRTLGFWAELDGRRDAIADALTSLALTDLAAIPVRLLSTGQRRRAAIARVVASGAPLWLLDEPANGLDAAALALLENAIARHRSTGGAVLVASHTPLALPSAHSIALADPTLPVRPSNISPGSAEGAHL